MNRQPPRVVAHVEDQRYVITIEAESLFVQRDQDDRMIVVNGCAMLDDLIRDACGVYPTERLQIGEAKITIEIPGRPAVTVPYVPAPKATAGRNPRRPTDGKH